MSYTTVRLEMMESISLITINRPEALNALNATVYRELSMAMDEVAQDDSVKVVIVTGGGNKVFVAGADIVALQAITAREARDFAKLAKEAEMKIEGLTKPVIAAINGHALGGGCELALACDLRIASSRAKFGQPEINLGLIPGGGGTQRLPRLIGFTRAKELIFTGELITAQEALSLGLINRVVEPENLMAEAFQLAKIMASKGAVALALAKAAINRGISMDLHSGLDYEIECFAQCFATEDLKEGTVAFLEKRQPKFKGR